MICEVVVTNERGEFIGRARFEDGLLPVTLTFAIHAECRELRVRITRNGIDIPERRFPYRLIDGDTFSLTVD